MAFRPEPASTMADVSAAGAVSGCAARLQRLVSLAEGAGEAAIAGQARELAGRVQEGRFYVACVGQFKRGKSTLINALLGQAILPMGFVPVTAVPTVVRFGQAPSARVRDTTGAWTTIAVSDLKQFVSEEFNPENKKKVAGVEVFLPSELLSSGMCLVDTPGLGSVFSGNTQATQAFIPHIDAALIVVGADPPLAGEELALVARVARQARDLIVILNKADRASAEEKAAAAAFTRELLEKRLQCAAGPVFEVSASEQMEKRGPQRDWAKLKAALEQIGKDSGAELAQAAGERGLQRLTEQLLAITGEKRDALLRPVEESERRIAGLKQTIAEAERSLRELSALLMAEQQRLSDMLVARHKAFLGAALAPAQRELAEALPSTSSRFGPTYRRRVLRQAQEVARKRIGPWLTREQEEAEDEYRRAASRFLEMSRDFLRKLAEAGLPELARRPHALEGEDGFRVPPRFTFREFIEVAQPASPLRWLADAVLGLAGAERRIQNDADEFLIKLLETNSSRVQSDILQRVQESRARLETEIRKVLHEVRRAAEEALARARKTRAEGEPAIRAELAWLMALEAELRSIATAEVSPRQ